MCCEPPQVAVQQWLDVRRLGFVCVLTSNTTACTTNAHNASIEPLIRDADSPTCLWDTVCYEWSILRISRLLLPPRLRLYLRLSKHGK